MFLFEGVLDSPWLINLTDRRLCDSIPVFMRGCVCVVPLRHREVAHMTDSITRLPELGVTPEVKRDLECVHSFTHSSIHPSSPPSFHCKEMSLGGEKKTVEEEENREGGGSSDLVQRLHNMRKISDLQ